MSHRKTELIPTNTKAAFEAAVERAAALVLQGHPVALPTETVYGLAANAFSPQAVGRVYAAKGRPSNNPLIVHVGSWAMVEQCVERFSPAASSLARAFWPGPLTLVLPKSERIPPEVTAGGQTVAIRWPSHPVMQAVLKTAGVPLAAPSANRSNGLSPTQAHHVLQQLDGRVPLIVDGGHAAVGIESTVVDLVGRPTRVLRPGMIHRLSLQAASPDLDWEANESPDRDESVLRSPGQLKHHYAPKARLVLGSWSDSGSLSRLVGAHKVPRRLTSVVAYEGIPDSGGWARVAVIPHDAEAYARALFSELHLCDESGSELIVVEAPPETDEWEGIRDRLGRAAAGGD